MLGLLFKGLRSPMSGSTAWAENHIGSRFCTVSCLQGVSTNGSGTDYLLFSTTGMKVYSCGNFRVSPACKHSFGYYQRFLSVSLSRSICLEIAAIQKPKSTFANWDYSYPPPSDGGTGDWCIAHTFSAGHHLYLVTSSWIGTAPSFGAWHGDRHLHSHYSEAFNQKAHFYYPFKAILHQTLKQQRVSPPTCLPGGRSFRPPVSGGLTFLIQATGSVNW